MTVFKDRNDAGRKLAERLRSYESRDDVIVLGLPRGGVPVGYEVALSLGAPLDIFLVRKLGVPGQEELAMGSIASGGVMVKNEDIISAADITHESLETVAAEERQELLRRESEYRGDNPPPRVKDRVVILVDDGLATGASMRAAVESVRKMEPREVVVAVPVADPQVCREFEREADNVVCVETPRPLHGVGAWYDEFEQVSDRDVKAILNSSRQSTQLGR
ncbi:phosphoribosyltransferase [candidate division GN15 bacterium]|nr:phosphoribosyltransferase [candidate division GN15 bacterium]